ncbi:MAG: ATP-binding cassette domain-containing protein [Deltaproteobacteria bacterium]|nr:ATP-binding cassette domain-containing protein [Deltaproteobacteria bacterium]
MADEALITMEDVHVHFPVHCGVLRRKTLGVVRAVDGLSLVIHRGETLGLVGESGCGKSTAGRALLQLIRPTSGRVFFRDTPLTELRGEGLRRMRRHFQMIFQDPYASLNPRMTVGAIIAEPIRLHHVARGSAVQSAVQSLMQRVGLNPRFIRRYPHEFSGGQRQRIGIARALAARPEFLVADEPTSALDVSIQAQILNLLVDLRHELHLTYLFISHDLAAVRHMSDRIAVMYLGNVVELAPAAEIYAHPQHPYTQALLSAIPIPDPRAEQQRHRTVLHGDLPSPLRPPSGCPFHTRCPVALAHCATIAPLFKEYAPKHSAACHRLERSPA